MRKTIGLIVRTLRRRRGWRQQDLGDRAKTTRQMVSRIERDELDKVQLATLRRVVEAVEAHLRISVDWQGEQMDRLIDASHARLQNAVAQLLESCGWLVRVEVSFNHYGDRGRYDIVAFHLATGWLLVVEIKVGIGDVQDLLGRLDVKVRLAPGVASGLGWMATRVIPMLVIAEETSSRRVTRHHSALFRRFVLRGRAVAPWLRRPVGEPSGILLFLELADVALVSTDHRKSA